MEDMSQPTRKMIFTLLPACLCLLLASLVPAPVAAADADNAKTQSPIVVNLKQFKVILDAKGEAKYSDASLVLPGDMLEYQATYTNRGTLPLTVTATLPVPEAVAYVKDSAKAKPALAHSVALKDSVFAQEPLTRKVAATGGSTLAQQVPYAEYRFVRWDLGRLAPGASTEVSIRAQVGINQEGEGNSSGKVSAEPAAK
jgi:uncharacterized repeat protein (TIGR01451 family)